MHRGQEGQSSVPQGGELPLTVGGVPFIPPTLKKNALRVVVVDAV